MFTCADISQDFFAISSFRTTLKQIQSHIHHGFEWQYIVGQSGMGKTTLASYLAQQCTSPFQGVHHLQLVENLRSSDWIWQPLSGFFSGQLSKQDQNYKANVFANLEAFKQSGRGLALLVDGIECLQNDFAWQDIATLKSIFRRLGPKFTFTFFSQPLPNLKSHQGHPLVATKSIDLPLWSYHDTRSFIHDRLHRLGTDQNVFSDELISVINDNAQGVPLRIVTLCETALMNATLKHENIISNLVAETVVPTTLVNKANQDSNMIQSESQTLLDLLRSRRSG